MIVVTKTETFTFKGAYWRTGTYGITVLRDEFQKVQGKILEKRKELAWIPYANIIHILEEDFDGSIN